MAKPMVKILEREIRSLSDLEESLKQELQSVKDKKKSFERRVQELLEGTQGDMFEVKGS